MDSWTRLCVDVDRTGLVLGISAERHVDGELVELSEYGRKPDEDIEEAFDRLRRCVEAQWGVQLLLWP